MNDKPAESTSSYLPHLITLLRSSTSRVLDVGCGAGNDVNSLLDRGFDAVGVDLSAESIAAGRQLSDIPRDRLFEASLPDLEGVSGRYDAVLCADVLHLIPDSQLLDSLYRLRSLVAPYGFLMLAVRVQADDELIRPPEQYRFFLERLGLREILCYEDHHRSSSHSAHLEVMVFSSTDADQLRPIEVVESVLWDDRKVNTYKFALIRAIAHLASHRPNIAGWEGADQVSIPIDAVTDLWIRYYWPLVGDDSESPILQGPKGQKTDMAFRRPLVNLRRYWQPLGGYAAFNVALQANRLPHESRALLGAVLTSVRTAIKQPVQYAGNDRTGKKMFLYASGQIYLPEAIWREAALLGRWIDDSVVIRWAEFSSSLKHQHPDVTTEAVLARLLRNYQGERDTSLAQDAYRLHARANDLRCVWTGVLLSKFDVDHAIPWSLWRSNDLWNLLPAHPRVNNEKRARIPSRARVEDRRDAIIGSWDILYQAEPAMFLTQARAFIGPNADAEFTRSMRSRLYGTFKDALEYTAVNRGVERW